jgi:TetR/AcrR family transcriptional regulator, cholesterol catabolism regulator
MKKRKVHLEMDEISEVAAKLFAEKGYSGTSMRDIANALNVSVASVYYYYKNKEGLLYSIIVSIGEELLRALKKAQSESNSPLEQLQRMIFYHTGLIKEKGERVKVYVEEQHNLSKRLAKPISKQHREIYDYYADQLRKLRKAKIISCEPPSIAAFAILGTLNWCYRWFNQNDKLSIEAVAEKLTDLLFYGIIDKKKH